MQKAVNECVILNTGGVMSQRTNISQYLFYSHNDNLRNYSNVLCQIIFYVCLLFVQRHIHKKFRHLYTGTIRDRKMCFTYYFLLSSLTVELPPPKSGIIIIIRRRRTTTTTTTVINGLMLTKLTRNLTHESYLVLSLRRNIRKNSIFYLVAILYYNAENDKSGSYV